MITSKVELITPELAKEYLKKADPFNKNRNLNQRYVSSYARAMKDGKWRVTHQGIAFDEYGYLKDGQHRLNAIIKANVPVEMMVTRGLLDCSYDGIDSGLKRSTRDIIILSGYRKDDAAIKDNSTLAAIRTIVRCGYNESFILSTEEILCLYDTFKDKLQFIYKDLIVKKLCRNSNMNAAALSALICGESEYDIYAFFSCFERQDISGAEGKNINAPFNWKKQLLEMRAKRIRMSYDKMYHGTQNAIWNFCRNTNVKQIKGTNKETTRYYVYDVIDSIIHNV